MMNAKILIGAGLLAALAASGCSTVLRGAHEKVEIVSTPPGALCRIYRESEGYIKAVNTPGAVYIARSADPIKVVCKKDGYKTASSVAAPVETNDIISNAATGAAFGSIAGVGTAILDGASGAKHDLPNTINISLQRDI